MAINKNYQKYLFENITLIQTNRQSQMRGIFFRCRKRCGDLSHSIQECCENVSNLTKNIAKSEMKGRERLLKSWLVRHNK